MLQTNLRVSQGDRFISQRSLNDDATLKFGTKVELFSVDSPEDDLTEAERRASQHHVNQQNAKEQNINEEENKKMYTALLQNQVLGIDNPFLLHEIHNSDEIQGREQLYSQMQRCSQPEEVLQSQQSSEALRRNSYMGGSGLAQSSLCGLSSGGASAAVDHHSSPFNSKFTVLNFKDSRTPNAKQCARNLFGGITSNDYMPYKGLLTNSTNLNMSGSLLSQSSSSADIFAQQNNNYSQRAFMHNPLTENSNPLLTSNGFSYSNAFRGNPISGFDEEQVFVPKQRQRKIPKIPYKVLDAPALQDDFYLNLVDWSPFNNLAVGLSSCIYIWSASSSKVTKLHDLGPRDSVTSVCWSKRGQHLSIGTNSGLVQVWDVNKCKLLRTMKGHEGRVGTIAWSSSVLSSGSKDKSILQRDLREKDDFFGNLSFHKQEVCGLKWSFDEQQLASGGNDNKLYVWSNQYNHEPAGKFNSHLAAVKAIAWSPHQHGLLASGGGTADRCIRFWNTNAMQEINHIETGSQVCNLVFSKNVNELVSTHGYSDNAIVVWKYPSMKKVATLTGHSLRVLYLAMSPDGESIVTGAGDETLRFWKVFPPQQGTAEREISMIDPQSFSIR